jgi:hypothetical protein
MCHASLKIIHQSSTERNGLSIHSSTLFFFTNSYVQNILCNSAATENTAHCTLETSKGWDRMLEDISATRGMPRVSGIKGNSTPATEENT